MGPVPAASASEASRSTVEEGRIDPVQYEAFVFGNAVCLHGGMNPAFFDGTACEKPARMVLDVG